MTTTYSSNLAQTVKPSMRSDDARLVFWIVIVVTFASLIVLLCYALRFPHFPVADTEEWARYGEYVGGTIGPIAGFATIVILWRTLQIQRADARDTAHNFSEQLAATRKQLAATQIQGFEQSLFSWLSLHRDILNAVQLQPIERAMSNIRGLHALEHWYTATFDEDTVSTELRGWLLETEAPGEYDNSLIAASFTKLETLPEFAQAQAQEILLERWEDLYKGASFQLDAYFRTLFRLFKWIDSTSSSLLTPEQRWEYAALVRAQLSWIELAFLFFNGMTERGKAFVPYCQKYALFDNFDTSNDSVLSFLRARKSNPYGASAFSSTQARKNPALGMQPSATAPIV
ncbi:hypothetical protein FAZ69_04495 [Trinickia terrae]|uniref:Uncharacterized protein n=1 Tax=Trinickia terrae TaxID=2571161 RepID=A0A4U1IDG7_9BURK|nr:putative phage abortive infection protein [Trinickia terrae]TKC91706.1 hypothetical protein FAZ69_04495 [Trinickia terrae]